MADSQQTTNAPIYYWFAGDLVRAFHPGMFGVIRTGRIVSVGRKYARVDFGDLGAGKWKVPLEHITERI